jgi:hypothetical protein
LLDYLLESSAGPVVARLQLLRLQTMVRGSALVLGEIALCWECVAEGLVDAGDDSRGRRPHHFVLWAGS